METRRRLLLLLVTVLGSLIWQGRAQGSCEKPDKVTVEDPDQVDFTYAFSFTPIVIVPGVYVTDPPGCPVTYSCETKRSVDGILDLCLLFDEFSTAFFNSQTGELQISSLKATSIPAGEYQIRIIGTVGDTSKRQTFTITVYNPCLDEVPGEDHSLEVVSPFPEQYFHDVIDDPPKQFIYNIQSIGTAKTQINLTCGLYIVEFFDAATDQSITLPLFTPDVPDVGTETELAFEVASAEMVDIGTYRFYFTITMEDWPTQTARGDDFEIVIRDACLFSAQVVVPDDIIESISYTIGTQPVTYTLPEFSTIPARCTVTSFVATNSDLTNLDGATDFNSDERLFTFEYYDSVEIAGSYTVTITATPGQNTDGDTQVSFTLVLENPCVDPALVTFVKPEIPPREYTVATGSKRYYHDPFKVESESFDVVNLCGALNHRAYYNDVEVGRRWVGSFFYWTTYYLVFIRSSDLSTVGQHSVRIEAEFVKYPPSQGGLVSDPTFYEFTFLHPCDDPEVIKVFNVEEQVNPPDYYYSITPARFTLKQPLVYPSGMCSQQYTCEVFIGARSDLCDIIEGDTVGSFDTTTGNYSLRTHDLVNVPEGSYAFVVSLQVFASDETSVIKTHEMYFDLTLIDPCPTVPLRIAPNYPFTNKVIYIFEPSIHFMYDVQGLAYHGLPVDCGLYGVSFYTDSGKLDPVVLDAGLDAEPIGAEDGREEREFSIIETLDPFYLNNVYNVFVTIVLLDYPQNKGAYSRFTVSILIEDFCVQRLVDEGVLKRLPRRCTEPVIEEIEEEVVIEEEEVIVEEQPEQPIEARPAIEPFWMQTLPSLRTRAGSEKSLVVDLGSDRYPVVSYYGDEMTVSVDFGDLMFAWFDQETNTIHVESRQLSRAQVGYYRIEIVATYEEVDQSEVSFTKEIYLRVDPPKQVPKITPVTPIKEPTGITQTKTPQGDILIKVASDEALAKLVEYDVVTRENFDFENAEQSSQSGPVPYIKEFSFNGMLRLGWDRQLQPLSMDVESLPRKKVAIEKDIVDSYKGARQLSDQQERLLLLKDAIEVKIVSDVDTESDEEVQSEISWEVTDFSEDEISLKFNFVEPKAQSNQPASDFDTFQLTFWDTKYFKDSEQREIPLGTTIEWQIFRQVSHDEADEIEMVARSTDLLFLALGCIALIAVLCTGPLLPLWMFFNSLQLIAHIPMIRTTLPAAANLFLLDFLSVVRLHIGALDKFIVEQIIPDSDKEDFDAIRSDNVYYYNELVNSCGYHVSLVRNLALVFCLFTFLVTIWLIYACKESFVTCRACTCCQRLGNRNRQREKEVWWNNFIVRFLYEVFFEIVICLMISFSVTDSGSEDKDLVWGLTGGLTFIVIAVLCFLSYLCIWNGPYVKGSYEPGSLKKSFWHYRALNPTLIEEYQKPPFENEVHQKAKSPESDLAFNAAVKLQSLPIGRPSMIPLYSDSSYASERNSSFLNSEANSFESSSHSRRPSNCCHSMESSRGLIPLHSSRLQKSNKRDWQYGRPSEKAKGGNQLLSQRAIIRQSVSALQADNHQDDTVVSCKVDSSSQTSLAIRHKKILYEDEEPVVPSEASHLPAEGIHYTTEEEQYSPQQSQIRRLETSGPRQEAPQFSDWADAAGAYQPKFEEEYEGGALIEYTIATQTDLCFAPSANVKKRDFSKQIPAKYMLEATEKAKLAVQAKLKLVLEETIQVNPRYKTIFTGLKKNHEHNVAIVHPMSFLLRRLIYAALIIFMFKMPLFVSLILLAISLAFLAFVIIELPWEDSVVNQQHFVNEIGLYVILVLVYLLTGSIVPQSVMSYLGWTIIGIVVALCIFNFAMIALISLRFAKVFLLRVHKNAILKNRLIKQEAEKTVLLQIGSLFPLSDTVQFHDSMRGGGSSINPSRYWPQENQLPQSQRQLLITNYSQSFDDKYERGETRKIEMLPDHVRASFLSSSQSSVRDSDQTIQHCSGRGHHQSEDGRAILTSVTSQAGKVGRPITPLEDDEMQFFESRESGTDPEFLCEEIAKSVVSTLKTQERDYKESIGKKLQASTPIHLTPNASISHMISARSQSLSQSDQSRQVQVSSAIKKLDFDIKSKVLDKTQNGQSIQGLNLDELCGDDSLGPPQSLPLASPALTEQFRDLMQRDQQAAVSNDPSQRAPPKSAKSITIEESYFSQDTNNENQEKGGTTITVESSEYSSSRPGDQMEKLCTIEVTESSLLSSEQKLSTVELTGSSLLNSDQKSEQELIQDVCQQSSIEVTGSSLLSDQKSDEKSAKHVRQESIEVTGSSLLSDHKSQSLCNGQQSEKVQSQNGDHTSVLIIGSSLESDRKSEAESDVNRDLLTIQITGESLLSDQKSDQKVQQNDGQECIEISGNSLLGYQKSEYFNAYDDSPKNIEVKESLLLGDQKVEQEESHLYGDPEHCTDKGPSLLSNQQSEQEELKQNGVYESIEITGSSLLTDQKSEKNSESLLETDREQKEDSMIGSGLRNIEIAESGQKSQIEKDLQMVNLTESSLLTDQQSEQQAVQNCVVVEVTSYTSEDESEHMKIAPMAQAPEDQGPRPPQPTSSCYLHTPVSVDDDFSVENKDEQPQSAARICLDNQQIITVSSSQEPTESLVTEFDDDFSINQLEDFLDKKSTQTLSQKKVPKPDLLPKKVPSRQRDSLQKDQLESDAMLVLPKIDSKDGAIVVMKQMLPELDNLLGKEDVNAKPISISSKLKNKEITIKEDGEDSRFSNPQLQLNSLRERHPRQEGLFLQDYKSVQSLTDDDFQSLVQEVEDVLKGGVGTATSQIDAISGYTVDSQAMPLNKGINNFRGWSSSQGGNNNNKNQVSKNIKGRLFSANSIPEAVEETTPYMLNERQYETPHMSPQHVFQGANLFNRDPVTEPKTQKHLPQTGGLIKLRRLAFGSEVEEDEKIGDQLMDPDSPEIFAKKRKLRQKPLMPLPKKVSRASADRKIKYKVAPILNEAPLPLDKPAKKKRGGTKDRNKSSGPKRKQM